MECEDVDFIHLSQGMVWWQSLVNTLMNLWIPKRGRKFLDHLSVY